MKISEQKSKIQYQDGKKFISKKKKLIAENDIHNPKSKTNLTMWVQRDPYNNWDNGHNGWEWKPDMPGNKNSGGGTGCGSAGCLIIIIIFIIAFVADNSSTLKTLPKRFWNHEKRLLKRMIEMGKNKPEEQQKDQDTNEDKKKDDNRTTYTGLLELVEPKKTADFMS